MNRTNLTHASVWPRLEPHLTRVRKPARYVGGEGNITVKDHAAVDSAWLLVYPDAYEVGQPNQGVQILYELLNERPTTVAERGFAPWPDLEAIMRSHGIPFFSLENHLPMRAFDVVGFSLATELGYTNLLNCLDLGGVPLRSAERADDDPLVVIGGHMHEYGRTIEFWDATTGKLLWHGEPAPAPPGKPSAVPVTGLYGLSGLGLRITAAHRYRVRVIYENPTGHTIVGGGMGVVGGLFMPDRKAVWPATDANDSLYQRDLGHFMGSVGTGATVTPISQMHSHVGH